MRIVSCLIVFVSIVLAVPCFAALPSVTDGLVGCWDFDQGSLVTAMDMSGNGNDGIMVNTTYSDPPPGSLSTASLSFNTNQTGYAYSYVTILDSPSLRPNSSLTLAAWVKTDAEQQRSCCIVTKRYGSSYRNSFGLWYQYGDLRFVLEDGVTHPYISIAQPPANEWHHIVATYNGSLMRLYVDGLERVNKTFSGTILYDDNPVLIGADCDNADHIPDAGWNGLIDEVLIYNRSLSQAEIAQIIPEFPSVLMLPLFMSATIIGVITYRWRRRKQIHLPFS